MTLIDKAEALALIDRKVGRDHPALADELRHAIRALPARGVGVKPLVWNQNSGGVWEAQTAFGTRYSVADRQWTYGPTRVWFWVDDGDEAAKAAAQSDYEARILAALEPTTTADPGDDVSPSASDPVTTPPPGAAAAAVAPTDAAQAREAIAAICAEGDGFIGIGKSAYDKADRIIALIGKPRT